MKLEYVDSLILAHPFVRGFEQVSYCLSDEEVRAVAQGEISETVRKRKQEDIEEKEGASTVYSTAFYIGLQIEPKQPGSVGPRRLDISYPTTEFSKLVKMWEKYDEATMGIVVRHIKSVALPDSVFEEGERPPRVAQKRVKAPGKSNNTSQDLPNKKRRSSHPTSTTAEAELQIPDNTLPPFGPSYAGEVKSPELPFGEPVAVSTGAR
jgi:poly(A) polymerase